MSLIKNRPQIHLTFGIRKIVDIDCFHENQILDCSVVQNIKAWLVRHYQVNN